MVWRWRGLTLALLVGYAGVYLSSIRPLDWHLHTSAWRIPLLPMALALMATGRRDCHVFQALRACVRAGRERPVRCGGCDDRGGPG
jgi:hypothetical protein